MTRPCRIRPRRLLLAVLEPLRFELHLFFKEIPLLAQTVGGVLGQDRKASGGIR